MATTHDPDPPPHLAPAQVIPHEGADILAASLAGLRDRGEIRDRLTALGEQIESEPPRSVRLLVDVTGAAFDTPAARTFRGAIRRAVPQLVAVALVGWHPRQAGIRAVTTAARNRLEIPAFAAAAEALDWLASEVPRPLLDAPARHPRHPRRARRPAA